MPEYHHTIQITTKPNGIRRTVLYPKGVNRGQKKASEKYCLITGKWVDSALNQYPQLELTRHINDQCQEWIKQHPELATNTGEKATFDYLKGVECTGQAFKRKAEENVRYRHLGDGWSSGSTPAEFLVQFRSDEGIFEDRFVVRGTNGMGIGLFSARKFDLDEIVTVYGGEERSSQRRASPKYTAMIGGKLVDAEGALLFFGGLLNSDRKNPNCHLTSSTDKEFKAGRIVATVQIDVGDELLLNYHEEHKLGDAETLPQRGTIKGGKKVAYFFDLQEPYFSWMLKGYKKLEFREATDFWRSRFVDKGTGKSKKKRLVTFRNGQRETAPKFQCEVVGDWEVKSGETYKFVGDTHTMTLTLKSDTKYFVLRFGNVLATENMVGIDDYPLQIELNKNKTAREAQEQTTTIVEN